MPQHRIWTGRAYLVDINVLTYDFVLFQTCFYVLMSLYHLVIIDILSLLFIVLHGHCACFKFNGFGFTNQVD